jgi:hypothetical protein
VVSSRRVGGSTHARQAKRESNARERARITAELPAQIARAKRESESYVPTFKAAEARLQAARDELREAEREFTVAQQRNDGYGKAVESTRSAAERRLQELADPRIEVALRWLMHTNNLVNDCLRESRREKWDPFHGRQTIVEYNTQKIEKAQERIAVRIAQCREWLITPYDAKRIGAVLRTMIEETKRDLERFGLRPEQFDLRPINEPHGMED